MPSLLNAPGSAPEASRLLDYMQRNTSIAPDATCFNVLLGGFAAKRMWGAIGRTLTQMRTAGVAADAYTYGPLLEACRKSGQAKRAKAIGRQMLLDEQLPLSPFCVLSLRRTIGEAQFKVLAKECGVRWADIKACLAKANDNDERRQASSRGGGGGAAGGSSSSQ